MKTFELGCVSALVLAMAACAEAPVTLERQGSRLADSSSDDDVAEDESDDAPTAVATKTKEPVEAAPTKKADTAKTEPVETKETAPPPVIKVNWSGAKGQTYGNVRIYRSCSDMGVDFNMASFADATSLSLVNVVDQKVLVKVEGEAFKALKNNVVNGTGDLEIPVDAAALPTTSTEYALIMGGDSRFGSPAACRTSLAPQDEKDRGVKGSAGRFPTGRAIVFDRGVGGTGCGIVGFLQAFLDPATKTVMARPTSPLIIAADDEGRAGFPKGYGYKGCDNHDSPLVLDLAGTGVTLGRPRAGIFDIDGDGRRDTLGWVTSSETPFLVHDANGNGKVDGASELFGNHTARRDSANGFEALASFDDVADGVIDSRDRVWSSLRLWFDRDHDGRSSAEELETLESRGIRSLATGYIPVTERLRSAGKLEGVIRQRGGATTTDGRTIPILDVWFERHF